MTVMEKRPLSTAEEAGWRRYWDGFLICPTCVRRLLRGQKWPVPADYSRPIKAPGQCTECGATVPEAR